MSETCQEPFWKMERLRLLRNNRLQSAKNTTVQGLWMACCYKGVGNKRTCKKKKPMVQKERRPRIHCLWCFTVALLSLSLCFCLFGNGSSAQRGNWMAWKKECLSATHSTRHLWGYGTHKEKDFKYTRVSVSCYHKAVPPYPRLQHMPNGKSTSRKKLFSPHSIHKDCFAEIYIKMSYQNPRTWRVLHARRANNSFGVASVRAEIVEE